MFYQIAILIVSFDALCYALTILSKEWKTHGALYLEYLSKSFKYPQLGIIILDKIVHAFNVMSTDVAQMRMYTVWKILLIYNFQRHYH